jgi:hypothetical protein
MIREERERLLARLEAIQKEEAEVEKTLRENVNRAAEAISVEEANITLLEHQEASASLSDGLEMSPFTWIAAEGWDVTMWAAGVPVHLGADLSTSKLSKLSKKACLIHQAGALSLLSLA